MGEVMINTRWYYTVITVFLALGLLGSKEALTVGVLIACLGLVFTSDKLTIRAYRLFDNRKNIIEFEKWMESNPEIAEAVKVAHNLNPDDFMTFCRVLIEARYKKDQMALEEISRQFRKEKHISEKEK